jgi:hypothetical protein
MIKEGRKAYGERRQVSFWVWLWQAGQKMGGSVAVGMHEMA